MYLDIYSVEEEEETTESEFINEVADEVDVIEEELFHLVIDLNAVLSQIQFLQERLS